MSITSYPEVILEGTPFDLQVSRGDVFGHESLYKFGFNSDVNGTEETIWTQGGNYPWPTAAFTAYIVSDDAADTSAGTGARTVTVQGLDENYIFQSVDVTLNGTTEVQIGDANGWLRVFRAFVLTAGSAGTAAGTILIQTTGGGTIYANLSNGNQTQMALYTVPAGRSLFLDDLNFTAAISLANNYAVVSLSVREFGGVFRKQFINTIQSNQLITKYEYPLRFPEKTDIECRAFCSNSNNLIGASFQGVLVDNSLL